MNRLRSTSGSDLRPRVGGRLAALVLLLLPNGASAAPENAGAPELVPTGCGRGASYSVDCSGGPRSSPFVCVRYTEACRTDVQLEMDGPWYELLGVNGVTTEGVVASAKSNCDAGNWKKRLAEDLPAIMEGVCRPFEATRGATESAKAIPDAAKAETDDVGAESGTSADIAKKPSGDAAANQDATVTASAEETKGTEAEEAAAEPEPASQPPLTSRVDLVLRDLKSGKVVVRDDVQADPEKRQLVQACWAKEDRCAIRDTEQVSKKKTAERSNSRSKASVPAKTEAGE